MALTTNGPSPVSFWEAEYKRLVGILNQEGLNLENELVRATPVGAAALLKQGWSFKRASLRVPIAEIGQNQNYFLPVEMGRRPGKGISKEGQESIKLWGRRKLGLSEQEASGLGFLLSRKYRIMGRKAVGFAGLAKPGTIPSGVVTGNIEPVEGGLIKKTFDNLERRLNG